MSTKNHAVDFERMWLKLTHTKSRELAKANRPAVETVDGEAEVIRITSLPDEPTTGITTQHTPWKKKLRLQGHSTKYKRYLGDI